MAIDPYDLLKQMDLLNLDLTKKPIRKPVSNIIIGLDEKDIKGIHISVYGRDVLVDRWGYELWKQYEYEWRITYTHFYLHRFKNGKLIAFHRELLGLHNTNERIRFFNGDKLDSRLINLETRFLEIIVL